MPSNIRQKKACWEDPVTIIGVVSPNELRLRCGGNETWSFVLMNTFYLSTERGESNENSLKGEKRYPKDNPKVLEGRDAFFELVRRCSISSDNFVLTKTDRTKFIGYGTLIINGEDVRMPLLRNGVLQLHSAVDTTETCKQQLREAEMVGLRRSVASPTTLRSYVRTESRDDSERLFNIFKMFRDKPFSGDVLQVLNAAKYLVRLHAPNHLILYCELDLMGILIPSTRCNSLIYDPNNIQNSGPEPVNRIDSLSLRLCLEATKMTDQLFGKKVNIYLDAVGMQQETWRHILLGRIVALDNSEDISMSLLRSGLAMILRGCTYVDPNTGEKIKNKKAFAPYMKGVQEEEKLLQAERDAIEARRGLWETYVVPQDGNGILGLGRSNRIIHVFIDNSNLWIEGKHTKGKIANYRDKIGDRYYLEDQTWRVDYPRLLNLLFGNNEKRVEHPLPAIFGSVPPKAEDVWEHCKKCGMEVDKVNRSRMGREKEVDHRICARIQDVFGFDAKKGDVFVLIAGDRDFCATLEAIIKRRNKKDVSVYVVSWSTAAMKLKHVPGVTYVNLDPYRDAITYSSPLTRTLNCFPLEALTEKRLLSVYPQQKRTVIKALKGHLTKDRDYKFTKQRLPLYIDCGLTIHIVFLDEERRDVAKAKIIASGIKMQGERAVEVSDGFGGTNRFAAIAGDDSGDEDEESDDDSGEYEDAEGDVDDYEYSEYIYDDYNDEA